MGLVVRLIGVIIVAGGMYFGFAKYNELKLEDEHKLELVKLEKDYLEKQNWVNDVPDPAKYRDERLGLAKWYFTELTTHYNRYSKFRHAVVAPDAEPAKPGKKAAKKDDVELKKQYFELVKGVYDQLKDQSYQPAYTGTQNSLRLDLYKVGKRTDGQRGFRFDLVLWGAQRQLDKQQQAAGGTVSRMNTAASFSGISFKFFDEKDKVAAEMPVTGDPEIKVDYPERWIEEFPPQAVIGYYEMPPIPSAAVRMEVTMTVTSRSTTGSDIPATFTWKMPVEAEWKLAPGETWEGATTEERSKDYIEGKAENP